MSKQPSGQNERLFFFFFVCAMAAFQFIFVCFIFIYQKHHLTLLKVARGGADGILCPSMSEKLRELYEAIASVAAKPKTQAEPEKKSEHILEDFHSSRTIRRLVLDCPAFASILYKKALSGKCRLWAQGHCSEILSAFIETEDLQVREMAKEELQVLVNEGALKIQETKKSE